MRHENAQVRFWAAMEIHRKLPFIWGERDCVMFAARMADVVSVDGRYVERAREAFQWHDVISAAKLLEERSLRDLVETVLGPAIPWQRCNQFAIVLVLDELDRECLTVHDGAQLIGPRQDAPGIQAVPFRYAVCGWEIL